MFTLSSGGTSLEKFGIGSLAACKFLMIFQMISSAYVSDTYVHHVKVPSSGGDFFQSMSLSHGDGDGIMNNRVGVLRTFSPDTAAVYHFDSLVLNARLIRTITCMLLAFLKRVMMFAIDEPVDVSGNPRPFNSTEVLIGMISMLFSICIGWSWVLSN